MANDKNGSKLFDGDEVVLRARVIHVQGDHVLTVGLESPSREFWFQGGVVERTAQGAASIDADKHANDAPAIAVEFGPIPAGAAGMLTEVPARTVSKRDEAIAFVMTKIYRDTDQTYTKEQAAAVVDEYGYGQILEDREAEKQQKIVAARAAEREARKASEKDARVGAQGQNQAANSASSPSESKSDTSSQAPTGASGSASAQPAAGTPQNEAPKEADGSAPASSSAA